jgi:hypothetical protein
MYKHMHAVFHVCKNIMIWGLFNLNAGKIGPTAVAVTDCSIHCAQRAAVMLGMIWLYKAKQMHISHEVF